MGVILKHSFKNIFSKPGRLIVLLICITFASFAALLAFDMGNNIESLMRSYAMEMVGKMDIEVENTSSDIMEGISKVADMTELGIGTEYHVRYIPTMNHSVLVIRCNQFNINLLHFAQPLEKVYAGIDSFIIYICTEGRVVLIDEGKEYLLNKGEVMLVPAITTEVQLFPLEESTLMEVYLGN